MIIGAFETLLERTPPAWMRKIEAAVLMDLFAEAFDVEPPSLEDVSADGALRMFREFTAACMEAVPEGAADAHYRARLEDAAFQLGSKVRSVLMVRQSRALNVARFFYRGIGIQLDGSLPGDLQFGPCSFSQRYTPRDCWFMSAFDEGFLKGSIGKRDASLRFSCRLTEGAPCCRARLG